MTSRPWVKKIAALLMVLSLAAAPDCFARGSGGSSFSGGGGARSSSSFSSSRSSSGWGSSGRSSSSAGSSSSFGSSSSRSSAPSTTSSWGSSTRQSSGPSSAADKAFSSKVSQAGSTTSRGDAATAAQAAQSQRYNQSTGSGSFTSQPRSNSDIPVGTTLPDGRYASVYYNSSYGGYGFWDSFGHWMMWNSIMGGGHTTNNYYYYGGNGGPYGYSSYGGPTGYSAPQYAHHSGSGLFSLFLFGVFLVLVLVAIGIYLWWKHSSEVAEQSAYERAIGSPAPTRGTTTETTYAANTMDDQSPVQLPTQLKQWSNLRPGAQIILSDAQAIADSQKKGEGRMGILYTVKSVGVVEDSEEFGAWVMVDLDDGTQPLMLLVKGVDQYTDYRIYYPSEDFVPSRRENVLSRGDLWLFQEPRDSDNYDASDLLYTTEIHQTQDGRDTTYTIKEQGERHGSYTERPTRSGMTDLLATVVEYSTFDATENPELLIVEIGAATKGTGEVKLYLGATIQQNEIEISKR